MEDRGVFSISRSISCKKTPANSKICSVLNESSRLQNLHSYPRIQDTGTGSVFNDSERHRYARSQGNLYFAGYGVEAKVERDILLGRDRNEEIVNMPYCSCKSKIKENDSPLRKTWMVNRAAKKKLGLDLEVLTRRSKTQWSRLDHALHIAEQQLEQTEDEARKPSILPVEKFLSNVKPAVKDYTFGWEDRDWTFLCNKSKCLQFPCIKPEKYHTIGFRPEVCDDRWASWEEIQPVYADYVEFKKKSILRDTVNTPSSNISDREAYLKKEWLSKRSANYKGKPKPWEVNYGKPVPSRMLKYPVRFIPYVEACSRLFY